MADPIDDSQPNGLDIEGRSCARLIPQREKLKPLSVLRKTFMFKSSQRKVVKFGTPPSYPPRHTEFKRRVIPGGPFGGDGFVSTELLVPLKCSLRKTAYASTGVFTDGLELTCKTPSAMNGVNPCGPASSGEVSHIELADSSYSTEHRTIRHILEMDELSIANVIDDTVQEIQFPKSLTSNASFEDASPSHENSQVSSTHPRGSPCRRRMERSFSIDSDVRRQLSSVVAPARAFSESSSDESDDNLNSQFQSRGYASNSSDDGDKYCPPPDYPVDENVNGRVVTAIAAAIPPSESYGYHGQCLRIENGRTVDEDVILSADLRHYGGTILSQPEEIIDSVENTQSGAVQSIPMLQQCFSVNDVKRSQDDPVYDGSRLGDLGKMQGRRDWLEEVEQIEDPITPASLRMALGLHATPVPLEFTTEPPNVTVRGLHRTEPSICISPARASQSSQDEVSAVPYRTALLRCKTSPLKDLCRRGLCIVVSRNKLGSHSWQLSK